MDIECPSINYVPDPLENGLTIYSEKTCLSCIKIIKFLNENNIRHTIIDCTNYFPHNINPLAFFVDKHIRSFEDYCIKYKNIISFPMIFNNGKFIGYLETIEDYFDYLKKAN